MQNQPNDDPVSPPSVIARIKNILKGAGLVTLGLALLFAGVTLYYVVTTPAETIIITTGEIPAGVSPNFTQDNLTDRVVARLQEISEVARQGSPPIVRPTGLGPRAVKQKTIPLRASSGVPSPVFDLTWRGISLNLCRRVGMHLKAKAVLQLGIVGLPDAKGWRMTALLKEGSSFKQYGSTPRAGGACADFEKCVDELAEQIFAALYVNGSLAYYIKTGRNDRVLELYKALPAESLQADDLVTFGNAYYNLGKFDEAKLKYQQALAKEPTSCPAKVARGFAFYAESHSVTGSERLGLLNRAEHDFQEGAACDPKNEYTRTALCHTLLLKWSNSPNPDSSLLDQAKQQCEEALKINPAFDIAGVNIGYILYRQERQQEALQYFEDLSQRHNSASLFLNYGFLLYREYLKDHSSDTLARATDKTLRSWNMEQSVIAANNLGYFYYEQGNNEKALQFWTKANELDAEDPDGLAGLALATYKAGQQDKAIALLSRAVQVDPQYRNPASLKKSAYWSDLAAKDLAKIVKLLPR